MSGSRRHPAAGTRPSNNGAGSRSGRVEGLPGTLPPPPRKPLIALYGAHRQQETPIWDASRAAGYPTPRKPLIALYGAHRQQETPIWDASRAAGYPTPRKSLIALYGAHRQQETPIWDASRAAGYPTPRKSLIALYGAHRQQETPIWDASRAAGYPTPRKSLIALYGAHRQQETPIWDASRAAGYPTPPGNRSSRSTALRNTAGSRSGRVEGLPGTLPLGNRSSRSTLAPSRRIAPFWWRSAGASICRQIAGGFRGDYRQRKICKNFSLRKMPVMPLPPRAADLRHDLDTEADETRPADRSAACLPARPVYSQQARVFLSLRRSGAWDKPPIVIAEIAAGRAKTYRRACDADSGKL